MDLQGTPTLEPTSVRTRTWESWVVIFPSSRKGVDVNLFRVTRSDLVTGKDTDSFIVQNGLLRHPPFIRLFSLTTVSRNDVPTETDSWIREIRSHRSRHFVYAPNLLYHVHFWIVTCINHKSLPHLLWLISPVLLNRLDPFRMGWTERTVIFYSKEGSRTEGQDPMRWSVIPSRNLDRPSLESFNPFVVVIAVFCQKRHGDSITNGDVFLIDQQH